MNGETWQERRDKKRKRAESGYTSIRVTRATSHVLRELEKSLAWEVRGLDELLYGLAAAELRRRGKPVPGEQPSSDRAAS